MWWFLVNELSEEKMLKMYKTAVSSSSNVLHQNHPSYPSILAGAYQILIAMKIKKKKKMVKLDLTWLKTVLYRYFVLFYDKNLYCFYRRTLYHYIDAGGSYYLWILMIMMMSECPRSCASVKLLPSFLSLCVCIQPVCSSLSLSFPTYLSLLILYERLQTATPK